MARNSYDFYDDKPIDERLYRKVYPVVDQDYGLSDEDLEPLTDEEINTLNEYFSTHGVEDSFRNFNLEINNVEVSDFPVDDGFYF